MKAQARRAAFVLATVVMGGLLCAPPRMAEGQVTDPGFIIVGSDLSGQWDFEMNVLYRSDPAIPASDTFVGSFTVAQTESTFTGSGKFNGLTATVGGTVTQDPYSLSVTLVDHIATEDSETHFTATLVSGDLYTGTFKGATPDGTARWDGVFSLKITRPTTQTPAEQIQSIYAAARQSMNDTALIAYDAIQTIVGRALTDASSTTSSPEISAIRRKALNDLETLERVVSTQWRASISLARTRSDEVVAAQPKKDRPALLRLIADQRRGIEDLRRLLDRSVVTRLSTSRNLFLAGFKFGENWIDINLKGRSKHKYPLDVLGFTVPLGQDNDRANEDGTFTSGLTFEVVFPKGPEECPNTIHQFIKETRDEGSIHTENPVAVPPAEKGGADGDAWVEDVDPDDHRNAQQKAEAHGDNGDGTMSYTDSPHFTFTLADLPIFDTTVFKIVLEDCHGKQLRCVQFRIVTEILIINGKPMTIVTGPTFEPCD